MCAVNGPNQAGPEYKSIISRCILRDIFTVMAKFLERFHHFRREFPIAFTTRSECKHSYAIKRGAEEARRSERN